MVLKKVGEGAWSCIRRGLSIAMDEGLRSHTRPQYRRDALQIRSTTIVQHSVVLTSFVIISLPG